MEEKMKREKNKNRIKSDDESNDTNDKTDSPNVELTTEPIDPNAPLIDEDGQSHNIDNAVQLASSAQSEYETISPDTKTYYETVTKSTDDAFPTIIIAAEASDEQRTLSMDSLPPPPRVEVESEKLEVIEIKSDGTTGHLTPLRNHS